MERNRAAFAFACTSTLLTIGAGAQGATVEWLGWLGAQPSESKAFGVSGDGNTVVGIALAPGTVYTAFRWTQGGGMQSLGLLGTNYTESTWANSANTDGTVIVGTGRLLQTVNEYEAWRWTADGGMIGLGDFPSGPFDSEANDVSGDGSIVVGRGRASTNSFGFVWTAGTGLVALDGLPGGTDSSSASAISPDGVYVVGTSNSASGNEGTVWTNGASPFGVGDLPGGSFSSWASGVSADGSIVVGGGSIPGSSRASRWTLGTGLVAISNSAGTANDISADGAIIVGVLPSPPSANTARIWISGASSRLLTTVLSQDYGIDTTGWIMQEATAVSDDGQVIVGFGVNQNESAAQQAFRVVLPRPGACCFGGVCSDNISEKACADGDGLFLGFGFQCADVDCTSTGACCFSCTASVEAPCPSGASPTGACVVLDSAACAALSGVYLGDATTCEAGCPCVGDITGDGNTDVSDFNVLALSFGLGEPDCRSRAQGDLNCDGLVNIGDFNILASDFGCMD